MMNGNAQNSKKILKDKIEITKDKQVVNNDLSLHTRDKSGSDGFLNMVL
jgi:hypothetical protein